MIKWLAVLLALFASAASAQAPPNVNPVLRENNLWSGQNFEQACNIAVQGTTFTPSCAVNNITITGSSQTIGLPTITHPPGVPIAGASKSIDLRITYTGAFVPAFAAGYEWQGGNSPPQCNSSTGPTSGCISAANGVIDWIECKSIDQTHVGCGPPLTAMAAPNIITHVQGNFGAELASGTAITVVTAAGIGAGHTITGAVVYENATAAVSSCGDGTNTYTLGNDTIGSTGIDRIRLFYKTGATATTGATTITCSFSASVTFMQVVYDEYTASIVDGSGAQSQINPGTAANAVSSGNFTTTQTDLIWGATFSTQSSTTMAVGTGFTALSHSTSGSDFSPFTEQKAGVAPGSVAATYTNGTNGGADTNLTAGIALH